MARAQMSSASPGVTRAGDGAGALVVHREHRVADAGKQVPGRMVEVAGRPGPAGDGGEAPGNIPAVC